MYGLTHSCVGHDTLHRALSKCLDACVSRPLRSGVGVSGVCGVRERRSGVCVEAGGRAHVGECCHLRKRGREEVRDTHTFLGHTDSFVCVT